VGLTEAGARRALQRLTETGVVVRVGAGRTQLYEASRAHPLVGALSQLFEAERAWHDDLIDRLRADLGSVAEIKRAWVDELPPGPLDPLHVTVEADPRGVPRLREELRARALPIERDFDRTIELRILTPGEDLIPQSDEAVWLAGGPQAKGTHALTHADRDERALRLSDAIATLVEKDPSLVTRTQRYLDRLLREDQGTASGDLREWREILRTYSVDRLRQFMVARNPRADRLRQSSPFFAVLDSTERDEVLDYLEVRDEA
jgi:hypothetical protein